MKKVSIKVGMIIIVMVFAVLFDLALTDSVPYFNSRAQMNRVLNKYEARFKANNATLRSKNSNVIWHRDQGWSRVTVEPRGASNSPKVTFYQTDADNATASEQWSYDITWGNSGSSITAKKMIKKAIREVKWEYNRMYFF